MSIILINPLDETPRPQAVAAPRLNGLAGKTIGLLDISKPGGRFFLDRVEHLLKNRYQVASVLRHTKPTFTKPAPDKSIDVFLGGKVDAVIEGLAD
ncbi:MAG TPA: hypothetical protein VI756_18210 [Blastocatellia bacterium]